jgi:cell division protein FtsB
VANGHNIIDIEDAYARRKKDRAAASAAVKHRRKKAKAVRSEAEKARRGFVAGRRIAILAAVIAAVCMLFLSGSQISDLRSQEAQAKDELAQKQDQLTRLEGELSVISDPEYVEEQARNRLRMVKPDETLYIFED